MGFEPTQAVTPLTVFKTVPLNHLGTPPKVIKLCEPPKKEMEEVVGFEPTQAVTPLTVFKTVPLNHLGTPPKLICNSQATVSLDMIYSTN